MNPEWLITDLTYMASETHDMDYFLLRYGLEDVGAYTQDKGTVAEYYGVLAVYGAMPYKLDETSCGKTT